MLTAVHFYQMRADHVSSHHPFKKYFGHDYTQWAVSPVRTFYMMSTHQGKKPDLTYCDPTCDLLWSCEWSYGGDGLVFLVSDEGAGEDLQFPEVGSHLLSTINLILQGHVTLEQGHEGRCVSFHQTGHKYHLWVQYDGPNTSPDCWGCKEGIYVLKWEHS